MPNVFNVETAVKQLIWTRVTAFTTEKPTPADCPFLVDRANEFLFPEVGLNELRAGPRPERFARRR
jgi:hypothetical protein